jgi:hypothetical protein
MSLWYLIGIDRYVYHTEQAICHMLDLPAKPALFFSLLLSLVQKSKENEKSLYFQLSEQIAIAIC